MSMEKNDNMRIYESVRKVPDSAKKPIGAGRLKGMTDVNPMWRIKTLTEVFGACGIGWKYEITKQWVEAYGQEVKAFCNVLLYFKNGEKWSEPIPGTGGSSMVTMERNGAYVSDEAYKMALTDALSVTCKALGVAADVYFAKDAMYDTKYAVQQQVAQSTAKPAQAAQMQPANPELDAAVEEAITSVRAAKSSAEVMKIWNELSGLKGNLRFRSVVTEVGHRLKNEGK